MKSTYDSPSSLKKNERVMRFEGNSSKRKHPYESSENGKFSQSKRPGILSLAKNFVTNVKNMFFESSDDEVKQPQKTEKDLNGTTESSEIKNIIEEKLKMLPSDEYQKFVNKLISKLPDTSNTQTSINQTPEPNKNASLSAHSRTPFGNISRPVTSLTPYPHQGIDQYHYPHDGYIGPQYPQYHYPPPPPHYSPIPRGMMRSREVYPPSPWNNLSLRQRQEYYYDSPYYRNVLPYEYDDIDFEDEEMMNYPRRKRKFIVNRMDDTDEHDDLDSYKSSSKRIKKVVKPKSSGITEQTPKKKSKLLKAKPLSTKKKEPDDTDKDDKVEEKKIDDEDKLKLEEKKKEEERRKLEEEKRKLEEERKRKEEEEQRRRKEEEERRRKEEEERKRKEEEERKRKEEEERKRIEEENRRKMEEERKRMEEERRRLEEERKKREEEERKKREEEERKKREEEERKRKEEEEKKKVESTDTGEPKKLSFGFKPSEAQTETKTNVLSSNTTDKPSLFKFGSTTPSIGSTTDKPLFKFGTTNETSTSGFTPGKLQTESSSTSSLCGSTPKPAQSTPTISSFGSSNISKEQGTTSFFGSKLSGTQEGSTPKPSFGISTQTATPPNKPLFGGFNSSSNQLDSSKTESKGLNFNPQPTQPSKGGFQFKINDPDTSSTSKVTNTKGVFKFGAS